MDTGTIGGRLAGLAVLALTVPLAAARLEVSDVAELRSAAATAAAGDEIVLLPGDYLLASVLRFDRPGPVTVRGEPAGCARVISDTVEAFKVAAPDWTFEDLIFVGVCADHSACEHAFHIVGNAERTKVRRCRMSNFNAQIKGNGEDPGGGMVWPDDVMIEDSELFNDGPRMTSNPVTPIDVVGGRRWVVRRNFIHDFQKGGGNTISYGAFLKGNSRDGLFEGNLVACHLTGADPGGVRIGLSFGGGGSGPDPICEDSDCSIEHQNGRMIDNLIVNCSDVGIYLNEALDCEVHHNTVSTWDDAFGIDVRFAVSSVTLRNNLLNGPIRERDGGTAILGVNLERAGRAAFLSWFADPDALDFKLAAGGPAFVDQGEPGVVALDLCGVPRDAAPDLGAIEYDGDVCDTTTLPGLLIDPPGGPPTGPGPSLRAAKLDSGSRIRLRWLRRGDLFWNVYRAADPATLGRRAPWTPLYDAPALTDFDPLPGTPLVAYLIRAVAPCSGEEAE